MCVYWIPLKNGHTHLSLRHWSAHNAKCGPGPQEQKLLFCILATGIPGFGTWFPVDGDISLEKKTHICWELSTVCRDSAGDPCYKHYSWPLLRVIYPFRKVHCLHYYRIDVDLQCNGTDWYELTPTYFCDQLIHERVLLVPGRGTENIRAFH